MKYAVDRIEEDIYVLENIESGEIIEVQKKELPNEVREGSIVTFNDETGYVLDIETEKNRRESLRERMERLKRLKDER